jgi:FkbM family methyltransferase
MTPHHHIDRKTRLDLALRKLGHHLPPALLSTNGRVERAYRSAAGRLGQLPSNAIVRDRFGNSFHVFKQPPVSLCNNLDFYVYYFGIWEPLMTYAVRRLVGPGQVCMDAGANVGWYTVLLASLVGPGGRVHAFEPEPEAAAQLEEHVKLNGVFQQCALNQAALGRTPAGQQRMYSTVSGLYSSLFRPEQPADRAHETQTTYAVPMESIDSYTRRRDIQAIDFLKVDVEGSEQDLLVGAADFFDRSPRLPIIQLEVNPATARGAGYIPEELLEWLERRWGYACYRVSLSGALVRFSSVHEAGSTLRDILCIAPAPRAQRADPTSARDARVLAKPFH